MDLDDLRKKYEELSDPIDTIKTLIWDTEIEELKKDLLDIICPYEIELEKLEEQIEELEAKEYKAEIKEREYEYSKERI